MSENPEWRIRQRSRSATLRERWRQAAENCFSARFSQAISLMRSLNGYGTLTEDERGSVTEDTGAETFVTEGLSRVLKINNICDNEHLQDCWLPEKFTAIPVSQYDFPRDTMSVNEYLISQSNVYGTFSQANTKSAAFETINGESIAVFYNPNCTSGMKEESYCVQSKVCMMIIYELNGSKGPNTVGKDIWFIGALYPTDSVVVAPMPYAQLGEAMAFEDARTYCKNISSGEYRMPNLDEAALLFVREILAISNVSCISSTLKRQRLRAYGSVAFALSQSGLRPYGNPLSENLE